ncbi:MAG TPA: pantothenate kinase, partial [Bacteroidia bacterium]|nr:pantothenate kinase [Bacteroidia bacterium]
NTRESILSGVELGMQNEISGFISLYRKKAKNLKLIMTGGDSSRFVRKLNLPIFAAPDLVNIGLKEILKFHDSKE